MLLAAPSQRAHPIEELKDDCCHLFEMVQWAIVVGYMKPRTQDSATLIRHIVEARKHAPSTIREFVQPDRPGQIGISIQTRISVYPFSRSASEPLLPPTDGSSYCPGCQSHKSGWRPGDVLVVLKAAVRKNAHAGESSARILLIVWGRKAEIGARAGALASMRLETFANQGNAIACELPYCNHLGPRDDIVV